MKELAAEKPREVIGIVSDIRDNGLNRDPQPVMYVPNSQVPDALNALNVVSRSISRQQFNMLLMSIFGFAAHLLAGIGVYGLMSYSVQQRTQEIGIRMALGAEVAHVRGMVVRQCMTFALIGVAVGLAAAFALGCSGLHSGAGITRPRSSGRNTGAGDPRHQSGCGMNSVDGPRSRLISLSQFAWASRRACYAP